MALIIDLTGQRFGRLTVIERTSNKGAQPYWLCLCDCGNQHSVAGGKLRSHIIRSCGCLQKELASKQMTTHGMHKSKTYCSWQSMLSRCTNKNSSDFPRYGGRGIAVCRRWLHSFQNFFDDMGERPKNMTIDRINNDGDYTPSNCRWADNFTQMKNSRSSHLITYNGKTKTQSEWSLLLGGAVSLIANRLAANWSEEKAVFTPVRKKRS